MRETAYSRVAAALREQILDGRWERGGRLPTERELCDRFDASRITIRRALDILEQEFLIQRQQGSGTFINPNPVRKIPLMTTDFSGSIREHAPELERCVEAFEWVVPETAVREALDLPSGEDTLTAVRVDVLRGETIAADRLYLARGFANRLEKRDLCEIDFMSCWSRVQRLEFAHSTQTIEAVRAAKPWSTMLGVRGGEPLLKETNVIYLSGAIPAGMFITHYRQDVYRFEATVDLRSQVKAKTA
jgi:GntR family transcriptional regulator